MKNKIMPAALAACLFGSVCVYADESSAARTQEHNYTGTIRTVDAKEKTLTVKGYFFHKTFNLAENCKFTTEGKDASLSDFRPGQRVTVNYQDASGVLVADRIAQVDLRYTGPVADLDVNRHQLTVGDRIEHKTFELSPDCKVVLKGDKTGSWTDVGIGHKVTVVYELPNDAPLARRIEQKSSTFVGTLEAVDGPRRLVKAKHILGDKKFILGDGCKIVINGKPDAQLADLGIGQQFRFDYDEVGGVNVVSRIAPAQEETTRVSQSAKSDDQAQK